MKNALDPADRSWDSRVSSIARTKRKMMRYRREETNSEKSKFSPPLLWWLLVWSVTPSPLISPVDAFVPLSAAPLLGNVRPGRSTFTFSTAAPKCSTLRLRALPFDANPLVDHAMTMAHNQQHSLWEAARHALESYQSSLQQHPIATKALTSGTLAVVGDGIAQYSSSSTSSSSSSQATTSTMSSSIGETTTSFEYNAQRGLAFLLFGALYTGTFQHYWFGFLQSHVSDWWQHTAAWTGHSPPSVPLDQWYNRAEWWTYFDVTKVAAALPSPAILAVTQLALNQLGMVPLVYMPLFFAMTGALANLSWTESWERAQSMYVPLLQRNYVYWWPVQLLQFWIIPTEWQIPYVSLASLVWTIILSSIATSSAPSTIATGTPPELSQPPESLDQAITTAIIPSASYVSYMEQPIPLDGREPNNPTPEILATPVVNDDVTDDVRLQDVQERLVPTVVQSTLQNPQVRGTTTGGLVGLLAAAAEDGWLGSTVGTLLLLGSSGEPETSVSSTGVSILAALGAAVGLWASTPRGIAPSGDDVDQEKPEDQEEDSIYNDFNMTNDVMRSQNDSNNNGYTRTAENELSRGANLRGDSNQSALGELEVDDVLIPR